MCYIQRQLEPGVQGLAAYKFRRSVESSRASKQRYNWTTRFLESALEHRSVWLLDVNNVPGEPSSWSDWHEEKYPHGRSALVGKFFSHHEPETFRKLVVQTLGSLLVPVVQNLTERDLNGQAILAPIKQLHNQTAFDHCPTN